jgi:hypothetical protein
MADGTTTRCRKTIKNPRNLSVRVQCERPKRHNDTGDERHYNRTELLAWYTDGRAEELPAIAGLASDPLPPHAWADLITNAGQMFTTPPFLPPTPADRLADWWRAKAESEIEQTVAKAVEYGSTDLVDIGTNLLRLTGQQPTTDAVAAELGIYFYIEGKLARWRSAIMEGRQVSEDTMLDIGIYVRMAQRVRESGGWPGIKEETE